MANRDLNKQRFSLDTYAVLFEEIQARPINYITFAGTERLRKWDTMRMWHDSFLRGAPTSGVGKRQRGLPQGSTGRKGPAARVRSCGELSPAPGGGQAGRREEPTAAAQDERTSAALVTAQDKTACES